jgi:dUTP pyrophosphatase
MVNAGVVDEGFRGMIKVILHNMKNEQYEIKKGDRIAQLLIEVIMTPPICIVDALDGTSRGESGFGSTGR